MCVIRDDQIGLLYNGEIVDFFGVVGEDGTNTNHEFKDGRAARLPGVVAPSAVWNRSEWEIVNVNPSSPDSDGTGKACAPGFFDEFREDCLFRFDPLEWDGAAFLNLTEPCSSTCGDVNKDDEVNVSDVVNLASAILDFELGLCVELVGDLNYDDVVDVKDVIIEIQVVTGPGDNNPPEDCSIYT